MKIIPIFVSGNTPVKVYSIHYEDQSLCEFDKLFEDWNNPSFLDNFFLENTSDLQEGYYGPMNIQEAIYRTIEEANEFENILLETDGHITHFEDLFKPLDNYEYRIRDYLKTKGRVRKGWLRIYAIKIAPACYIITGGAIKLTLEMRAPHLALELRKLEKVKSFLRDGNILDDHDLNP